jgi:hypothetical protein
MVIHLSRRFVAPDVAQACDVVLPFIVQANDSLKASEVLVQDHRSSHVGLMRFKSGREIA